MKRSTSLGTFGISAVLIAVAGNAHAAAGLSADVQLAVKGSAGFERAWPPASPAPDQVAVPTEPSHAAQVTISRAADHTGRPVYFSRSTSGGSAGLVSFSSRALPADAVFSVALRAPRTLTPGFAAPLSGSSFAGAMPSLMPVSTRALTSGFGLRQHPVLGTLRAHSGVDLAASWGSPIVATSDGVVNTANWAGGYGLLVALDHGGGLQTRYGHMSRIAVAPGQQVRKGEVIGYVGSTGMSTGPHLHYEIRINGQAVNPANHLHGR